MANQPQPQTGKAETWVRGVLCGVFMTFGGACVYAAATAPTASTHCDGECYTEADIKKVERGVWGLFGGLPLSGFGAAASLLIGAGTGSSVSPYKAKPPHLKLVR